MCSFEITLQKQQKQSPAGFNETVDKHFWELLMINYDDTDRTKRLETMMKQWDSWVEYYINGGKGSWPRDAFEALIDYYEERVDKINHYRFKTADLPRWSKYQSVFSQTTDTFFRK